MCFIEKFFTQKHFEVDVATTLTEAKKCVKKFSPDFIILDNNLPDGNGWDSADWFLNECPAIHLFLISAYRHDAENNFQREKITVFEKPLSFSKIENLIRLYEN